MTVQPCARTYASLGVAHGCCSMLIVHLGDSGKFSVGSVAESDDLLCIVNLLGVQ